MKVFMLMVLFGAAVIGTPSFVAAGPQANNSSFPLQMETRGKNVQSKMSKRWLKSCHGKYVFSKGLGSQKKSIKETAGWRMSVSQKRVTIWLDGKQRRYRWNEVKKDPKGYSVSLVVPENAKEKSAKLIFSGDLATLSKDGKPVAVFKKATNQGSQNVGKEALTVGEILVPLTRINAGSKRRGHGVHMPPKFVSLKKSGTSKKGEISVREGQSFQVEVKDPEEEGRPMVLQVDSNRNGKFEKSEMFRIPSKKLIGKYLYAKTVRLQLQQNGKPVPYAVLIEYMIGSGSKQKSSLGWRPVYWAEGKFKAGSVEGKLMLVDSDHDGQLTSKDLWSLAKKKSPTINYRSVSNGNKKPVWYRGVAFELVSVDDEKLSAKLKAIDTGMTEKEAREKEKFFEADLYYPRTIDPVPFYRDFSKAKTVAKKDGKKLLVLVHRAGCDRCKKMTSFVFQSKSFVTRARNFVCVKTKHSDSGSLKVKPSVDDFPTCILMTPDGKEVRRFSGYMSVEKMKSFLKTKRAKKKPNSQKKKVGEKKVLK